MGVWQWRAEIRRSWHSVARLLNPGFLNPEHAFVFQNCIYVESSCRVYFGEEHGEI